MPLSLLAPWFLGGLALLAVPILVHLTRRDRTPPTAFPSLMFLGAVPHETVKRRRLRDWPLLLLRCLALALLAVAFARPFVDRAEARIAPPGGGGREVVILLDRSYSMGAGDRWARAAAAARRTVDDLGSGDLATVVAFDNAPRTLVAATADRARLAAALDSVRPGAGGTRYTPALALASQLLARSARRAREVVLVTDFQRSGWRADDEARLPAGVRLVPVDVGAAPPPNVAVGGVELARAAEGGGGARETLAATARLTSTGGAAARDLTAVFEVNGRAVESRPVRVPASGAATVAFAPVPLPEGALQGRVRVDAGDALPADDAFHFTAARGETVRVLVLDGPQARATGSLYLRRALAVGDQPPFRAETRRVNALQAADLDGRAVVFLNDAPPTAAAARLLVEFVRAGGGLVVALGEASAPAAWPAEAAALLPATPGKVTDRTADGGARLATVDRAHPVFAPFAAARSGDLAAPRVLRYRAIGAGAAAPAARFDDGAPALVEHALGAGRVLVWASTLDNFWTDLAVRPVFVPLVHRLATHAARHAPVRGWYTAGETLDLAPASAEPPAATAEWVVRTPSGTRQRVGGARGRPAVTLAEQGFYAAAPGGDEGARGRVVAVNLDPAEGDLARVEPAVVAAAVERGGAAAGGAAPGAAAAAPLTRAEREERQSGWWYLLAGALALLAIEGAVANRFTRPAR